MKGKRKKEVIGLDECLEKARGATIGTRADPIALVPIHPGAFPHPGFLTTGLEDGALEPPLPHRCIDSRGAPKGRPSLAQANGLGLQNVPRLSPEGAIYEITVQPHRWGSSGNLERNCGRS